MWLESLIEPLGLFWFGLIFVSLLWIPPFWLALSIFTPKSLLERYFKPPHFTHAETVLMASFPGFLMRTVIFGWLAVIPKLDRKRQLKDVRAFMPRWYRIALQLFIIGAMTTLSLILALMAFLMVVTHGS